jgi:hypothetical protein
MEVPGLQRTEDEGMMPVELRQTLGEDPFLSQQAENSWSVAIMSLLPLPLHFSGESIDHPCCILPFHFACGDLVTFFLCL